MSYIKTLKNGEFDTKKPKSCKMTHYDKFVAKRKNPLTNDAQKVVFTTPKSLFDMQKIVDEVLQKRGVVFELNLVEPALHQRMLDFLFGANYVLKSQLKIIGKGKYLMLPKGMEISTFSNFVKGN